MPRLFIFCIYALALSSLHAEWLFPHSVGTAWEYTLRREPGIDQTALPFTRKIVANADSRDGLRLENAIDDSVQSRETWQQSSEALLAISRSDSRGVVTTFDPSVTLLPNALESGKSWNFFGEIAGLAVAVPQTVANEEEVEVPAGKFRATRIHGQQNAARRTITDRWFVRGIGWVKETVTERSPSGELLLRNTLELTKLPVAPTAQTSADQNAKPLEVSISTSSAGSPLTAIPSHALQIVARWRVQGAAEHTRLRAVWIAEETGEVAPPNFTVDEASSSLPSSDAVGVFTLSRPADGWAAGRYRVDFFLNEKLAESAKLTIAESAGR